MCFGLNLKLSEVFLKVLWYQKFISAKKTNALAKAPKTPCVQTQVAHCFSPFEKKTVLGMLHCFLFIS